MFEIAGKEISELNDTDLRSLVGLLCEAELRSYKLPTAGVTWGGHQTAKDGGLDVRVQLLDSPDQDGFIPRSATGFQVKKPDMPPSKITDEMCPKGKLRAVIRELTDNNGAYIIVSGNGSNTDSALGDRRKAMRDTLFNIDNASALKTDFYDRDRMASWVRCHPSLILWVRGKLGNPIQGWQPFGNWAKVPGGIEEEYLLDEEFKIHNPAKANSNGMTALDGINCLRKVLQRQGSSVRLAGLSGVGKTRLVQALFDERIGEAPLNQSTAFYSDISNSPNPDPLNFAERVVALKTPAIIIVENCPPELHRHLTTLCTASGSLISLITVEYDVREDQPDETDVFQLEPSSTTLIENIIKKRFSHISQIDSRTISESSGGNARIAIALANTLGKGGTLADLKDEELFNRLFIQGNEPNSTLLKSAEVCSLVYSFDCSTEKTLDLELRLIGSLAGRTVAELFSDIAELTRRDLVQKRGTWRAILPHALANRLAKRALKNIPLENILCVFEEGGSERLLRSFSKRLSYLHQSEEAIEIAQKWLSTNGLLDNISNLNELVIVLLSNIAPITPRAVLDQIELTANREGGHDFTSRSNSKFTEITRLLRALAYDPVLFKRSVELLCRFALSEDPKENYNSISDCLKSLFYIYRSGTHASPEQRLNAIKQLVDSHSQAKQELGLSLLNCALEASHWSGHYQYDFGAHSRDYGYKPKCRDDALNWFNLFVNLVMNLALSENPIATPAQKLLAGQFRGLWTKAGLFDQLETATEAIISKGPWNDGWVAVQNIIRFDANEMTPELLERLLKLKDMLAPDNLLEKARIYALSTHGDPIDLVDAEDNNDETVASRHERVEIATRKLGGEVACAEKVFKHLLPEILSTNGIRLHSFGQGLGDKCLDIRKMWQDFSQQLGAINDEKRNYQVLGGFLNSISKINIQIAEELLNEAVLDSVLGRVFPLLQAAVKINESGVERLKQSLEHGIAPIRLFRSLGAGSVHESINDTLFSELVRLIASKLDGLAVAIDILSMRTHGHGTSGYVCTEAIKTLGQALLNQVSFDHNRSPGDNGLAYNLSHVAGACLIDDTAQPVARKLCIRLGQAFVEHKIYSEDYTRLLETLATKQPLAFLDGFLGENSDNIDRLGRVFSGDLQRELNPLSKISDDVIIKWCESNPHVRYPILASCIASHRPNKEEKVLEWSPLALKMIDTAPDPIAVLTSFQNTLTPLFRSESLSNIMAERLGLLSILKTHENPAIAEWAGKKEKELEIDIVAQRLWESDRNRSRDERFE